MKSIFAFMAMGTLALADTHIHMTIDTLSGNEGDPIIITVGYLPTEDHITLDESGRVLHDGGLAVFELHDAITAGEFAGWAGGDPIVFTSDFFFATGRLDGGDFGFEIVAVTPIEGDDALAAFGEIHVPGELESDAVSDADDRPGRTYEVGVGGHQHGQAMAASLSCVYDITVVAWDANARYADSAPVTFRVMGMDDCSAPCVADLNNDGLLNIFDFLAFQSFFSGEDPRADLAEPFGVFNIFDFLAFQTAFGEGC